MNSFVLDYAQQKLHEPRMIGWIAGSLTLLGTAYSLSPGAKMAKTVVQPDFVPDESQSVPTSPMKKKNRKSIHVNDVATLFKIAVPSLKSRAGINYVLTTVLIFLRTYVSVTMASSSGVLGKVAVEGDVKRLLIAVMRYLLLCLPATILNVSLDYLEQMQELHFRENLTRYITSRYLSDKVFFRMAGLNKIDNVDHRITEDVAQWAKLSSKLYSSILRPLTEAIVFTFVMKRHVGWKVCASIYAYYCSVAVVLVKCAPHMLWLTEQRLEKESAFRKEHQQILSYAEELSISRGQRFSQENLNKLFSHVTDQARLASFLHAKFNLIEIFLTKYCSVLLGYVVAASGVKQIESRRKTNMTFSGISGTFAQVGYSFQILAKAIGRFLWNIKLILVVNSYSTRVMRLLDALDSAEFEAFRQNEQISLSPRASLVNLGSPMKGSDKGFQSMEETSDGKGYGRVIRGEHIEFVDVPLVLPTGETLCESLSFYVKPGMNLLIMGPNGCGKSSTFRLLGELWPLQRGTVIKPNQEQIYYVPQRPYMYDGTLFEQIIYPKKRKEAHASEADLYNCLEMAGLENILSKPNVSWDSYLSWCDDSLSLGEKQRLAMARLFFHRPRFAILDECSSLIDLDVEEKLYKMCHELGITLITIAHRRTVWRHHNFILKFDGHGGYVFAPLRFENNYSTLVLDGVISSLNEDVIGTTVRISVAEDPSLEEEEPQI